MPVTSDHTRLRTAILERIRSEYLEMPGLRLTAEQVRRLCGVDRAICQDVLNALVDLKFLSRKPDGAYARLTDGADVPRSRVGTSTLVGESSRVLQGIAGDA